MSPFIGGVIAFAIGLALDFLTYFITSLITKGKEKNSASVKMTFRTIVDVLFIVTIFLVYNFTPFTLAPLLIGGALGVLIGSIVYYVLSFAQESGEREKRRISGENAPAANKDDETVVDIDETAQSDEEENGEKADK